MKTGPFAFAAAAALALAACNQAGPPKAPAKETAMEKDTPTPPPAPPSATPAADRFARALEFDCGAGGKLSVDLDYGQERKATTQLAGGPVKTLAMDAGVSDAMAFAGEGARLKLGFGDETTYSEGTAVHTCKFVERSLPAPAVPGVVRDVTIADAGKTIVLKPGDRISISLVGVPTAGYVWAADQAPAFVKVSDGPGGATSSAQLLPGFTGGNHWEVLVVEAVSSGSGDLILAQRRPWETKTEPASKTFTVKLQAG